MFKILKYTFFDLIRSSWNYLYFAFFLITTIGLVNLSGDATRSLVSMMNIVVVLVPLISTLFGVMYYYNSRDFLELLLAQPLKRLSVFAGQYFGLVTSLVLSYVLGVLLGLIIGGTFISKGFLILLICGSLLTVIFTGFAYLISILNENRIKGFGIAILLWLFLAVIYDGLFLLSLIIFKDYPLENLTLLATLFNPIDLSRILIILDLDISALMGFSGAVFTKFFGSAIGMALAFLLLCFWAILPSSLFLLIARKKDF